MDARSPRSPVPGRPGPRPAGPEPHLVHHRSGAHHAGASGYHLATWNWAGRGPTVVILPGAGTNGLLFADLVTSLGARRVVAVDPPGVGRSDPAPYRDLDRIADDLAALISDRFETPVVWLGHSWGGKVAAMVAGRHPNLAAAAVLIDPSPAGALPLDDEALERFATSIWDGADGPWPDADTAIDRLRRLRHYRRWTPAVDRSLRVNLVTTPDGRVTTRSTHADLYAEADATLRVDHGADVAAVRCPILYLVASDSLWWQELSNDVVLPDHAERVDLDGQHLIHIDQPQAVAVAIGRFLDRHAPRL